MLFDKIQDCRWQEHLPDPFYFEEDDGSDACQVHQKRASFSLLMYFKNIFIRDPKERIDSAMLVNDKFIKQNQDKFHRINKNKVAELFTNI